MTDGVSPRRRAAHAVGATVLTGGLTYVFLAIISRALDDSAYDAFSVYWSLSLIIGFGLFLPVEQELSRLGGAGSGAAALGRAGVRVSLEVAVAGLALLGLLSPLLVALGVEPTVLLLAAGFLVVSALQFATRGLLLGAGRLITYSRVLVYDSVLRVALALALAILTWTGVSGATGVEFALALMVAILLAHVPFLVGPLRRGSEGAPSLAGTIRSAMLTLIAGTVAAQLLLNVGPILIDAAGLREGLAGAFQATFSVARIPLFILVPLQGALVAPLAVLVSTGRARAMTSLMLRIAAAIAALAVVAAVVAALIGPWGIELVFGEGRALEPLQTGLLVAGVFVHAGLVISVQALIAAQRHLRTTYAWLAAVSVFVVATAALWTPVGAVTAVAIGFLVGSLAGWAIALRELRSVGRGATPPQAQEGTDA
jgi:O-antigen/teichoic acid export membrane protein